MPGGGNPAKSRILAPLHGAGLGQVPASELSCAKGTEVALYHPGLLSPAGVLGGAPTRLLGWGVGCSMAGSLCSSSAFQSVVSSHSRPAAEVSLFVCGFAPGARSSFPGISSVSGGGEPAAART